MGINNKSKNTKQISSSKNEIQWNPISENWRENLKDKWWSSNYQGDKNAFTDDMKSMMVLRDKLLEIAGDEACLPVSDEDYNNIINRGEIIIDEKPIMMKGLASQCHMNSALLWDNNRDKNIKIMTGYALSPDGMWRQHSWCVMDEKNKPKIVETTEPRAAYYGFVLSEEESEEFFLNNAL